MTDPRPQMREVNPATPPEPLDAAARSAIAALALRQKRANSVLMQVVSFVGGQVEDGLKLLPSGAKSQIEEAARRALAQSYDMAGRSRTGIGARIAGDRAHKVLGAISGALGGLGGLPTALAELPVATTFIFRAVQGVAAEYGEDPSDAATRVECLRVFGSGGPDDADDGIDTAFIGARLSLTGPALNKLIAKVAPKFAVVLSQKLASQAVPVLGAAAGAGTNYAFLDYYTEIAHVHFGLRQLSRSHGDEAVADAFHAELAKLSPPLTRA